MSEWYAKKVGRGVATTLAAGLLLGLAGCGGEEKPPQDKAAATTTVPKKTGVNPQPQSEAPAEPIAVLSGQGGLELAVLSATRDQGGFVTVSGKLTNTSGAVAIIPAQLGGNETEIIKHGNSLGGATLVDAIGKKRYYVLRDTDGRPLTTTDLSSLASGAWTSVFMQFPAPPATTTEVSLQLPTFTPATITLS
ncbi:hypothetical protein [Streptomyces roseicoloratus]|uniref:hypothetical protein n=1 Tax=Streptomyces roseicoloratus TaxID=2508722 RepID=UPI001009D3F1|nr:hypothetical protein [Streptomyces roseicoloratus]